MVGTSKNNKPTKAQRAAQSARDKALARSQAGKRVNGGNMGPREGPTVAAPVSLSKKQNASRPVMSSDNSTGDLRVRVRHREYIQDLNGSVAFANTQLGINPGLSATFPWLSQMAQLFESYKFNSLRFQYRTQAPTSVTGKVLLAVDYDAADAAPASKAVLLQERTKADDVAWQNFDVVCDRADLHKFGIQRYIRSQALAANLDIKTYDIGNLNVATQGQAGATAIGEVWVEYDVELITPNNSAGAVAGQSEKVVANGSVSRTNIFGNTPAVTFNVGRIANAVNNTLTFTSSGDFLIEIVRTGTTLIAVPVPTVSVGMSTPSVLASVITGAATSAIDSFRTTVIAGGTMTFDMSGDATDTACVVRIAQYQNSLA